MTSCKYCDFIREPVVTEKSTYMSELGKFTFYLVDNADKSSVKIAIANIFQVKVNKVTIINVKDKRKIFKGIKGWRLDRKKVIVSLDEDYTIDFAGGIK